MKHIFSHNGKMYSGHIMSDTSMEPHLYWFLFDGKEMQNIFPQGDLAFAHYGSVLQPVHQCAGYEDLVEVVKQEIREYIAMQPPARVVKAIYIPEHKPTFE